MRKLLQRTQKQLDELILNEGESDSEVVQARGDFELLYKRLESIDNDISDKADSMDMVEQLVSLNKEKADKEETGNNLAKLHEEISKTKPTLKPLWKGEVFPVSSDEIEPSKKLSDCVNGWLLQFQRFDGEEVKNEAISYEFIPKHFIENGNSGYGMAFNLRRWHTSSYSFKYIYVYNNKLKGHNNNGSEGNGVANEIKLTFVYEY